MRTSVVFRLAIGLPRSADTEFVALINKPKQNIKKKKKTKVTENISTMFSKWEETHLNTDSSWSRRRSVCNTMILESTFFVEWWGSHDNECTDVILLLSIN